MKRILDHYEEATRGMAIKSKSIFRDYKDPNLNVWDAIKRNTETFDREGTPIDKSMGLRVGDSIKLRLVIDSPTGRRGIKLPPTDFKVVSCSKDNNLNRPHIQRQQAEKLVQLYVVLRMEHK